MNMLTGCGRGLAARYRIVSSEDSPGGGGIMQFTTAAPHGLVGGESVTITGHSVAAYNGTWAVSGPEDVDTFITDCPNLGQDGTGGRWALVVSDHSYRDAVDADASSFWRLAESSGTSLADRVGSATLTASGVTLGAAAQVTGDPATGGTFNGTSSTASAANSTLFDPATRSTSFAVEALVRPNVTRSGGATEYTAASKMLASGTFAGFDFQIAWNGSKTVIRAYFISNFGAGDWVQADGVTDLQNGTSYHLAWEVYESRLYLFVDGVPEANVAIPFTGSASNSATFRLGSRNAAANWYKGDLQDVAYYTPGPEGSVWVDHFLLKSQRTVLPDPTTPPAILFSTDMASDTDDAGDLAVLSALANAGECSLLAVTTDSANLYGPSACRAILDHYDLTAVPVYAWTGSDPAGYGSSSVYTEQLRDRFRPAGEDRDDYPASTAAIRQLLHDAADGSVTVLMTGFATAVNAVLQSPGDGIDARSGVDLIAAKVGRLVVCAGIMPGPATEFNFENDPANYSELFADWPSTVPVVVVGIELVGTADPYTVVTRPDPGRNALTDPVKYAYDLFGYSDNGIAGARAAWGQLAALVAARGVTTDYRWVGVKGSQTVNGTTGANTWTSAAGNVSFVALRASAASLRTALEALMNAVP